jgi:hypothetical protein
MICRVETSICRDVYEIDLHAFVGLWSVNSTAQTTIGAPFTKQFRVGFHNIRRDVSWITGDRKNILSFCDLNAKLTARETTSWETTCYGTRQFINTITRALHLYLSRDRSIQYTPHHSLSTRSILLLSTNICLGLPSGHFHSGFPTNNLYTFLFSPIHSTCPAYSISQLWNFHSVLYFIWNATFRRLDSV